MFVSIVGGAVDPSREDDSHPAWDVKTTDLAKPTVSPRDDERNVRASA